MKYKIVLAGGRVLDPKTNFDTVADVAILGDKIVYIGKDLHKSALAVYNVKECLVCPGFIDFHAHVLPYGTWGVSPDDVGPPSGVTTFVDMGTAGPNTIAELIETRVKKATVRIFCYIHIAYNGLEDAIYDPRNLRIIGELEDMRRIVPARIIATIKQHPEIIRGIKVRASIEAAGSNGILLIHLAKELAQATGRRLAVHIGEPPPTAREVLPLLRPGDILTHAFRGPINALLDSSGAIIQEAQAARARGVLFDVGHGQGSFSFYVAQQMLMQGFLPDLISSDVHSFSIHGPAYNLITTMNKFMTLGLPLSSIIRAVTWHPAVVLEAHQYIGSLEPGYKADISILKIEEGEHHLYDTQGEKIIAYKWLVPIATFKDGRLLWKNKDYVDWDNLPSSYIHD
ncbi:MAG: amidohydrolase/deacetylase family metallohydrolase [Candidatus Hadarchaeum sp.]|uniref:amidohydrolase/deacetylase family metallohydrolase n=1 Tax=Candidatus Hadarchaeum sp. TaxID=2883567 RepID=UPI0031768D48